MRKLFLVLIVIFVSGCGRLPPSLAQPPEPLVVKPSATASPIVVPSFTPSDIPPTFTLEPTADVNFFRDDFTDVLDPQWHWVREDSPNWSLAALPGSLQVNVDKGYVAAHNNSNMLLRPAPEGNFQIETQITFNPKHNYQFAGLILYESDSTFIQAGRQHCTAEGCVGDGFYMSYYKQGYLVKPTFGQPYNEINPFLLRLSRREDTYTFEASSDGKVWFLIGKHTSNLNPGQIGLVTGQDLKEHFQPAVFDYFEVRGLP